MSANNEPPTDAEDPSADGKNPSQRRIFGTKRHASPAPAEPRPELEQKLASLVDSVKNLQTQITGEKTPGETPAEAEPKQRRLKRFQRAGGEELADLDGGAAPGHEARGDQTALNKNIAWPRLARTDAAPPDIRSPVAASGRKHPTILYVLAQIAGLALLLLGYWFGQSSAGEEDLRPNQSEETSNSKVPVADPLARAGVNDRALEAADQGLRAEKTGNLDAARQTWESAAAGRVRLPGSAYRLAMIDVQRGDLADADIHLSDSLAAGEMMASCYFVNACFAGKKSNYVEAAKQISQAVRVEPFSAKYLFCWGEALRRAGKPQAAVEAITQALDRPASPSDIELFIFKRRLTRMQAGHDDALEAELAASLAKTPVPGDWLLLAAARDLNRAAFPAAAGHLKDARSALTPDVFNLLVRDYAYQGYAAQPEVAALLKVPLPPASPAPLDPGAWPAEEADPAVWPPFSPAL